MVFETTYDSTNGRYTTVEDASAIAYAFTHGNSVTIHFPPYGNHQHESYATMLEYQPEHAALDGGVLSEYFGFSQDSKQMLTTNGYVEYNFIIKFDAFDIVNGKLVFDMAIK